MESLDRILGAATWFFCGAASVGDWALGGVAISLCIVRLFLMFFVEVQK